MIQSDYELVIEFVGFVFLCLSVCLDLKYKHPGQLRDRAVTSAGYCKLKN